ncbi:MAG TPA: hypothetical protein VGE45_00990 [Chloroflexia bacterium]|jgi:hypothetical protein
MTTYYVSWKIELDADSPREAAREALKTMRDESSLATHFTVIGPDGEPQAIDLSVWEEGDPDED